MTTTHPAMDWFAGDDWEINATLLDEHGNPYDLSQPHEIKWALANSNQTVVLAETDVVVSIVDPPTLGQCVISVPAAKTATLAGGHYNDAIRLVVGGVTSTLSTGPIYVTADPWLVQGTTQMKKPALRSVG
jgi:hypothetical protein